MHTRAHLRTCDSLCFTLSQQLKVYFSQVLYLDAEMELFFFFALKDHQELSSLCAHDLALQNASEDECKYIHGNLTAHPSWYTNEFLLAPELNSLKVYFFK